MESRDKLTHIGFTGTGRPDSLSSIQRTGICVLIESISEIYQVTEAHHGDCIEADEFFHNAVASIIPDCAINLHPSDIPKKRAYCQPRTQDKVWEPKPPLERNVHIVQSSIIMIAAPRDMNEQPRGGTWHTVRKARKNYKPVFMIFPDGTIKMDKDRNLNLFNEIFGKFPIIHY